jgi:hypothetical protein
MRTVRLPGRTVAVVVAAAALVAGGGVAYAAVTVCPTQSNPSHAQLEQYMKCRLDAIEVKVDALAKPPVTTTVTSTVTAAPTTVTVTATPSTTTDTTTTTTTTEPPVGVFPDADTTGVPTGTTLKRVPQDVTSGAGWHYDSRGWLVIDGAGTVFSEYSVSVDVSVEASNVTISKSQIVSNGWPVALRHAQNVTIDQSDLRGASATSPCDNAIRDIYGDSDSVKITANDITWCSSGINHFDAGGLIQGNFIHDLKLDAAGTAHINGIQLGSGTGSLMTIRGNTIHHANSQTDAIMLANDDGAQANRLIEGNLIGGGGYTFYGAGGPTGTATGITFRNNQFTTRYFPQGGYWGPVAYWKTGGGNVWSGNTWADGPNAGQPVNP